MKSQGTRLAFRTKEMQSWAAKKDHVEKKYDIRKKIPTNSLREGVGPTPITEMERGGFPAAMFIILEIFTRRPALPGAGRKSLFIGDVN